MPASPASAQPTPAASAAQAAPPAEATRAKKPLARKAARKPSRGKHNVYVIELDDRVWNHARFRTANAGWQLGKPFVYVGMTALSPDVRFDKHKAGIQANSYVTRYGLHLLPRLYERYNPMTRSEAEQLEVDLGLHLKRLGYGVWQA